MKKTTRPERATHRRLSLIKKAGLTLILIAGFILVAFHFTLKSNFLKRRVETAAARVTGAPFTYNDIHLKGINRLSLEEITMGNDQKNIIENATVEIDVVKSIKTRTLEITDISLSEVSFALNLDKITEELQKASQTQLPQTQNPLKPSPKNAPTPSGKKPAKPKPKTPVAVKRPSPATPPPPIRQKPPLPSISINNATINLSSDRLINLPISVNGISLEVKPEKTFNKGILKVKNVTVGRYDIPLNLTFPIQLDGQILTLLPCTQPLLSASLTTNGKVILNPALTFIFNARLQAPNSTHLEHPTDDMLSVDIAQTDMQIAAQGSLYYPKGIHARASVNLNGISANHKARGSFLFSSARCQLIVKNGSLIVPHYILASDEISILGNAVTTLGKGNLVCRIITNDHWRDNVTKLSMGTHLANKRNFLLPLDTPDRYFRDIYFTYRPDKKIEFYAYPAKGWTSLDTFLPFLQRFAIQEIWTEEQ